MRRENLRSRAMRGLILGLLCATAGFGVAATPPATLQSVDVNKPGAGDELILRIEGDFSFKAFQASQDTILIDLMGVEAGKVAPQAELKGGVLKSYSLLQYTNAAHTPVTHLRLSLAHSSPFHAEQTAQGLKVAFGEESVPAIAIPATSPAKAEAGTGSSSAEIQKISVTGDVEGQTIVDVATTGRAEYRFFRLPNPERLVVDFEGAHRVPRQRLYHVQSAVLENVRVAQFRAKDPSVVRPVADLVGDPTYEVQRKADGARSGL